MHQSSSSSRGDNPSSSASTAASKSRPTQLHRNKHSEEENLIPHETSPLNMGHGSQEEHDSPSPPIGNDVPGYEKYTLYEKKCLLINNEIDRLGMGRYQWCIWTLCGFGYLLDLMWAQAFGLVLPALEQEFGFQPNQGGNISTAFNAGLTAGAAFWGILVDIVGRRWAFNLTVLFSSAFGLALGGSNSYNTFLVLTAFAGFGVGGNVPIDTTITLEFIPQRRRRLLPLLSLFQPIGVVITTAIAYAFIPEYGCKPDFTAQPPSEPLPSCRNVAEGQPCCSRDQNMGWRYTLFTIGAITMFVFILRFFCFRFQESPKYLIGRGRDQDAVKALHYIANFNKTQSAVNLKTFEDLESEHVSVNSREPMIGRGRKQLKPSLTSRAVSELQRYKMLFASPMIAYLTILVWLTYICDYFGFTVAGFYLPIILIAKNASQSVGLKETYRSYVYIYLPGILGVLLGVVCYDLPRFGRKWTMVTASGLMAVSLFVYTAVDNQATNIGLSLMEYFFQSMFNAVLYGFTPESFAAPIRGTACGIASFWGRLSGIVSPLIAQNLLPPSDPTASDYNRVLFLAGGITLGCVVFTAMLPSGKIGGISM